LEFVLLAAMGLGQLPHAEPLLAARADGFGWGVSTTSYLVLPQDTCGPMARTVTDAATVMDVLAGYDPGDPYSVASAVAARARPFAAELDPDGLRGARVGLVTNALGPEENPQMAAVNAVVRAAVEAIAAAGATVVEVEIPDLMDHIVATSMYTDRFKHDIDLFLSQLSDSPIRPCARPDAGQYHRGLDLMDEIVAGPDDPEASTDYLRRFAARHEFTLAVLNLLAGNARSARLPEHPGAAADDGWSC
jgi:amidase